MEDLGKVTQAVISKTIDFNGVLVGLLKTTATKSVFSDDISTSQKLLSLRVAWQLAIEKFKLSFSVKPIP
jgi:hypothetical protein